MVTRHLVIAVRPSAICIGVTSLEDDFHLIPDLAGTVVHPLDAHYVWREGRDLEGPLASNNSAHFLETYGGSLDNDGSLENDVGVGTAVTSLVHGVTAFVESRSQREIHAVSVVHPQYLSLPLLGTFDRQAGFETYSEELSACELEAVETALRKSGDDSDKPGHLLFLGEIPADDVKTVGQAILVECLPSTAASHPTKRLCTA